MAVFHFLFLKIMIKYLKLVYHTWDTLLIILIDILLSKSTKRKVQTIFYSTKHWGKKTVLVHLCTTSICLAVKTFIKRVWAIVQQHLPLPEIINAWEALFLVFMKSKRKYMHIANQNAKKYRNGFMDCLKKESNNCCDIKLINVL